MIFLLALQHLLSPDKPAERDDQGFSTESVWGCFSNASWAFC